MNKMFKKIFAVVAACATVATMSISAFAAGETASHEAGSVSVKGYAAVSDATQYTVMVFEDSFTTDYDVAKIFYINQGADFEALLTGMLVKGGELADGDYTVRIGNDAGKAIDVDLKVAGETVTFMYGDVTGDGNVDLDDATEIINYVLWLESDLDDGAEWRFKAANISADRETNDSVDLDDATEIINYVLWLESTLDDLLAQ